MLVELGNKDANLVLPLNQNVPSKCSKVLLLSSCKFHGLQEEKKEDLNSWAFMFSIRHGIAYKAILK